MFNVKWDYPIKKALYLSYHCYNIHVHSLDNPYQSAYNTGHLNETALLSIKNEVHQSLS